MKHAILFAIALLCVACGDDAGLVGDSTYGVTPGGSQDIEHARSNVSSGRLPQSSSLTVEGILSQHDLGVSGPDCDELICVRPALGIAPSLETGEHEYWVQIGMKSGLKGEYRRPPIDIAIVIDKSSSMSIDMEETNIAAQEIVNQLTDRDRLTIITFDDNVQELLPNTDVSTIDKEKLNGRIAQIVANGSANIMGGLQKGYENIRDMDGGAERLKRVVILSCGYPDSGRVDEGSFVHLVETGAEERIGLTFVGVLLGYNEQLAQRLGDLRGGNSFYLSDLDYLETIFVDEFDFIVSSLAYDMHFELTVDEENYEIAALYGLPGDDGNGKSTFEVATAFLSQRKGGMLARLHKKTAGFEKHVVDVSFDYTPDTAFGFVENGPQEIAVTASEESQTSYFDSTGVRKTVALAQLITETQRALDLHHSGDEQEAQEILDALIDYLVGEAHELNDIGLAEELAFVRDIRDLM